MASTDLVDVRGLAVTAPNSAVVGQVDTLIDELYYYRPGVVDRMVELLEAFPEFPLAHVLIGYSLMTEGTLDAEPKARSRLRRAEALPANRRERLHQEALRAWLDGDVLARAAAWERILLEWPHDLLAFRQYTGTLFWVGDKRYQAEVVAGQAGHWSSQIPGYGHFLSAMSFAMEEVGNYEVAERAAHAALSIQRQDLWALHGLAHVLEMQGRIHEGIELLGDAARFLNDYNLFRGHLWWHLSLFKLSLGCFDQVLELFDREIYPKESTFYLDVQNGVSLLARMEFQGVDVGTERWERLAQASLASATQCTLWFTAMHHVMALVRSGRESAANATLRYLESASANSSQAALASELSQAAAAFYRERPGEALERMLDLRQRHGELGASHAQQDLYDQIMVVAALRLADLPRVRRLLKVRLSTRVWDASSWGAFERLSQLVDSIDDREAVRDALRWALGESDGIRAAL
jgi:tetratricopeptide (TPR) repeat protein